MADIPILHDSFVRLAPRVRLVSAAHGRRLVVHYGETPCGEIELAADDHNVRDAIVMLADRSWRRVAELARTASLDVLTPLLETFLDQEWLHVNGGAALRRCATRDNTLGGVVEDMTTAVADAVATADAASLARALLDVAAGWRHRGVSESPPWSGLTLDLTPFEFSANFDVAGMQLRAVGEPQSATVSAAGYWQAANDVAAGLAAKWGADIGRVRALQDLFAPSDPGVPLAAFYGVGVGRGRDRPTFKMYWSPAAAARGAEAQVLGRACERLGLAAGWSRIRAAGGDRRWTLICLDLAATPRARFKVYETLLDADRSVEGLDRSANGDSVADLATMLTTALPPSMRGFSWGMVSHTLRPDSEPKQTFGVSIRPGARQGPVRQAVEALLARLGLDSTAYTRCFRALAAACDEPVEHSYVTVQRVAGTPRVTTYFAPRLYQSRFGIFEAPVWPSPVPSFSAGDA